MPGCCEKCKTVQPDCTGGSSPFKPRTSPANLLANLKLAYEERNAIELLDLLATDFEFYFSEADQQQFPEPLKAAEEYLLHTRMFDPAWAMNLRLDYHVGEVLPDSAMIGRLGPTGVFAPGQNAPREGGQGFCSTPNRRWNVQLPVLTDPYEPTIVHQSKTPAGIRIPATLSPESHGGHLGIWKREGTG